MASSTTVAQARAALWPEVDPANPNSPEFLPALNMVAQELLEKGYWKNCAAGVDFNTTDGYLTLPRQYESIIGFDDHDRPRLVTSRMVEFMTSGPGFFHRINNRNLGRVIDQWEVPTMEVQTAIGNIRLAANDAADYGKVVRVYGNDENGNAIYTDGFEGVDLTLGAAPVTTSQEMWLTDVDKPLTERNVDISVVVSGTPTVLSHYEPTETNPLYRRYKVGVITRRDGDDQPAVRTLCKRRFIQLVSETDLIYPSNIRALRFGLMAVKLEQQGSYDVAKSQTYWQQAYQALDDELGQQRGGIVMTPNMTAFALPGACGNLH